MSAAERVSAPFVLTRVFDAARERVFAAFTEQARLQAWMTPAGFASVDCRLDLRPGGTYHYGMRAPDGHTMWGKWTFREIDPPSRLVVVVQFSDAAGGVTRHPMAPTWPLNTLSTSTFEPQGDRTLVRLEWRALDPTPEEEQTFDGAHAGMTQGWTGTMDQLAAYLASGR